MALLKVPSGVPTPGKITGYAATYSPDANGNYTVTDREDLRVLIRNGYTVIEADVRNDMIVALTGVNPSATLNTYGTAQTVTPAAANVKLKPMSLDLVFGGTFGSETLTVEILVTYSDGTTTTIVTYTATGTGTTALTNAQLRALYKDAVYIVSIRFRSKSSLGAGSSIATLAVNGHITQE